MHHDRLFRWMTLTLAGLLLVWGPGAGVAPAQDAQLPATGHVDLLAELGRPLPHNTLKLFRAAVDSTARRLYVTGILTPYLAVLDLETDRWIASIDSGLTGYGYRYVYADEANGLVFVHDGRNASLTRLDPATGTTGKVTVPARVGTVFCDGDRGLVYLLTPQAPSFRAYREDTLEPVWSNADMGSGITSMTMDPATGELLILDGARRGPVGVIHRFDPDSRSVTDTIQFDLPSSARAGNLLLDPVGHRMLVVVGTTELRILAMDGSLLGSFRVPPELDFQTMTLDPDRSRILVVANERPSGDTVAGVGGHLLVIDPASMDTVRDLGFARKLRSVALDPVTGVAYLPNADAGTVWKVNPGTGEISGLRLGDSAEQLLPVDGGRRLIINSRLGGSYLMAWDVEHHTLETFAAGTWPIPLRYLAEDDLLLVLNAWDGTLSLLDASKLAEPPVTVALDLPPGTTDRLPDLAVDPVRRLAFAAYPEHGAVAVVDLAARRADGILEIPGAVAGDTGGGPGQLLLGVDPALGTLLAVEPARGRVTVFSIDGRTVIATSNFSPADTGPLTTDMLFVDEAAHGCWVGRVELSTSNGVPTGRVLPRGDRIAHLEERSGVYRAAGVEPWEDGFADMLITVDRNTLEAIHAWRLGAADLLHSSLAFLPDGRLWRVRMTSVDLDSYRLQPAARRPSGRVLPAGQAAGASTTP